MELSMKDDKRPEESLHNSGENHVKDVLNDLNSVSSLDITQNDE